MRRSREQVTTPPRAPADRREILALAIPAFLALIAEPAFLLVDSAIIGHLGTAALAGLGVASAALVTAAGIFVFLAYGTTSLVARRIGAGDRPGAISVGVDGLWLALILGLTTAVLLAAFAPAVASVFGASPAALEQAVVYLRIAAFGLPGMLVVLAVTGVLRGLQDTRTPLVVSVGGFTINAALNLLFVNGFHWGIAGSAWGTFIAQSLMGVVMVVVLVRAARHHHVPLAPHVGRVIAAAKGGVGLLIRTLALRGVLLLTTWVAAGLGDVTLASHQVAATIWGALAFALDALAIAAQALTGRDLGASRPDLVRATTAQLVRWGLWFGLVCGVIVVALRNIIPPIFSDDPQVQHALSAALIIVGLGQVISGYVFVLDGVLIGAGDGPWLAKGMVFVLVAFTPLALWVHAIGSTGDPARDVVHLWLAFTGFMVIRAATLWWRERGDAWLVTGATRG